ncbi:MAG: FHA domain-containing protein [Clostridiales bacterium]|nr:FHA domain-containing protein [Clostridiales bacterium]
MSVLILILLIIIAVLFAVMVVLLTLVLISKGDSESVKKRKKTAAKKELSDKTENLNKEYIMEEEPLEEVNIVSKGNEREKSKADKNASLGAQISSIENYSISRPIRKNDRSTLLHNAGGMGPRSSKRRIFITYYSGTAEKTVEMSAGTLTIGRDPSNDIVVASDAYLGRNHAMLFWKDSSLILKNVDAKNGSFINGRRVDIQTTITESCILKLGATIIRIKLYD